MSTNQYPEGTQQKKSGGGGCLKVAGIGCGILILIAIIGGVVGWSLLMKNPTSRRIYQQFQSMGVCAANMGLVGKALNQYSADHNGRYPARLSDLYPKYITDRSKLVCPSAGSAPFEYRQPAPSDPDNRIAVTCRQHVVVPGQPPILVTARKDGKVETDDSAMRSSGGKPGPGPAPTPTPVPSKP